MAQLYKGVIFDFNGTLFLDGPKHIIAWKQMIQEIRGTPLTQEECQWIAGPPNLEIIHHFFPKMQLEEAMALSSRKEALYRELCLADPEFTHLVKGAYELFAYLKAHQIPFTIASASIQANIEFFIETFGLKQWFDTKQIVFDDGYHADKTAMYWHACRNIKVPPEQCIIFEDSASGIHHAKKVGAGHLCVICNKEDAATKRALGADSTIQDFTQFQVNLLKHTYEKERKC